MNNDGFVKAAFVAFADSIVEGKHPLFKDETFNDILRSFAEWQNSNNVSESAFNELWEGPVTEYLNTWLYAAFCSGYYLGFGEGEEYERER